MIVVGRPGLVMWKWLWHRLLRHSSCAPCLSDFNHSLALILKVDHCIRPGPPRVHSNYPSPGIDNCRLFTELSCTNPSSLHKQKPHERPALALYLKGSNNQIHLPCTLWLHPFYTYLESPVMTGTFPKMPSSRLSLPTLGEPLWKKPLPLCRLPGNWDSLFKK